MTDRFQKGDGDLGCLVAIAIVALCLAGSWAKRQPGTAAMVLCASAAIWLAWNLWKKHRCSMEQRKAFEERYGAMLGKFEKDVEGVDKSFKQVESVADSIARDISAMEQKLRTFS